MKKRINIVNLLKNKKQGIKLWADAFGKLTFEKIVHDLGVDTIITYNENSQHFYFMSDGRYVECGESILVPSKEMRNWSKFTWKKGDVLVSNSRKEEVIFVNFTDDSYCDFIGKHMIKTFDTGETGYVEGVFTLSTDNYNIEVADAAQCYINTIEERFNGKLNMETLEVEPVVNAETKKVEDIKPKCEFKPFDKILYKSGEFVNPLWTCGFFCHQDMDRNTFVIGSDVAVADILPYNEDTAKLIGTTDTYKED